MDSSLTHACLNCGTMLELGDKFCSQCGQDTANHPPTLFEFTHEFVSHYVAAEGKLWRTLWGLIARPGFLTMQYLAGRKQHYVLPLRLILTLGLVFFLTIKFLPAPLVHVNGEIDQMPKEAIFSADLGDPQVTSADALSLLPDGLRAKVETIKERWESDPKGTARSLGSTMLSLAPYAVLCSLPFFASLLKLLYWRQPYGLHFVFAMHLHAAWYAMLLLSTVLPWTVVGVSLWVWSNAYPVMAMRKVYETSWRGTLYRSLPLALMHLMILLLGIMALAIAGVFAISP